MNRIFNIRQANWWYPLLLLLVNVISKSLFLTRQDIGLDEPFSIYHAQFNVGTIIAQLKNYNNPPLFELLLHGWIGCFGISALSVRIFPILFASLAPVALYYFGRRFFSFSVGVAGSLLLSASSLLIWYAHDCRVYSLFLLLSILSAHFFMALLQESKSSFKAAGLFVFFSTLLVYAHYFGAFILAFEGIYALLFHRPLLKRVIACYFALLLLYAPHLYVMLQRMSDSVAHGTWLKAPEGIGSLYNMLWAFSNAPVITVLCLLILVAAFIKYLVTKHDRPQQTTVLLIIWFFAAYLGMFLLSYRIPMYISRYLIFVLPAYYLLLAIAVGHLFSNTRLRTIALGVLIVGFAGSADYHPDKKQKVSVGVDVIKQLKDSSTLVLACPHDFLPAFAYYYNRAYFASVADQREYHLTGSLLKKENVYVINEPLELGYINLSAFNKIIYFGNGEEQASPHNPVLQALHQQFHEVRHERFNSSYSLTLLQRN